MPKHLTLIVSLVFLSLVSKSQVFIKDYSCTVIETEAKFKDSINGWDNYLKQTIDTTIPVVNCAPPGSYKIEVRFLINKDGALSEVKALTAHGYGMEAEAIRAIKSSPSWVPATRNGRLVRAYRRQSFVFSVPYQL
jgi:protein TonB